MIVFTDKGDSYFWAYSPSDNRQQICFKVRQLFNYNCDKYDSRSVMVCYYKVQQLFILKIVKICYAVRPFYHKVRRLLKSATEHTLLRQGACAFSISCLSILINS